MSLAGLLEGTDADVNCWGCSPLAGDEACPDCACCGADAAITVPLDGWQSLNGASHSVSWCARCWDLLLTVRKRRAPTLPAIALTLEGEALLRHLPQPLSAKRKRGTTRAPAA